MSESSNPLADIMAESVRQTELNYSNSHSNSSHDNDSVSVTSSSSISPSNQKDDIFNVDKMRLQQSQNRRNVTSNKDTYDEFQVSIA
jgi:hypothetical protein